MADLINCEMALIEVGQSMALAANKRLCKRELFTRKQEQATPRDIVQQMENDRMTEREGDLIRSHQVELRRVEIELVKDKQTSEASSSQGTTCRSFEETAHAQNISF